MRFLHVLINTALRSAERFKHGAVVVRGGRVLSIGYNKGKIHAEVDALKKVSDPSGTTLYVVRIGHDGKLRLSRPCNNCLNYAINCGVKRIVYSIADGEYGVIEDVKNLERRPKCY